MTEQIALRFPDGTKDRIKAVSLPGETMTATMLRAIGQLEGSTPVYADNDEPLVQIRADFAALAGRVAALEVAGVQAPLPEFTIVNAEPDTTALIRARELKANGASYPVIAGTLTAEGYRTPNGKPFNKDSVFRLLK